MSEKEPSYRKVVEVEFTDIVYDHLTSKHYREKHNTNDPNELIQKFIDDAIRLQIKRGHFEDSPEKEEIYRIYSARPEPEAKESK